MSKYCFDLYPDENGEYIIHKVDCCSETYLPSEGYSKFFSYRDDETAMTKISLQFPSYHLNGCQYCLPEYHTDMEYQNQFYQYSHKVIYELDGYGNDVTVDYIDDNGEEVTERITDFPWSKDIDFFYYKKASLTATTGDGGGDVVLYLYLNNNVVDTNSISGINKTCRVTCDFH